MTTRLSFSSPRLLARLIAVFFLLTVLAGIFAQAVVSERLINFGDATATATNILTNQRLYRFGFTIYLIEMACQITAAVLSYQLFKPVNRTIALLALFMELTGCVVKICARVFFIAPLFVLSKPAPLSTFNAEQLRSIALIFLNVNDQGAGVAVAFFGFSTLLGAPI